MNESQKQPFDYRPPRSGVDRYERNGWIGLAVTLAVCAIVAILYLSIRR